ncbi:hypothetical protein [Bernardetia sp.]|uniref:hypothetical protein n=1 Tax=Bernardetia sp. TaxID=1937974 RepID=UPI0025BDA0D2|nr:hypothetical protein [Bernardetia sp.]
MKNRIGTTLIFVGIVMLFEKVEVHYGCFGGYRNNAYGILFSSLLVLFIGWLCTIKFSKFMR